MALKFSGVGAGWSSKEVHCSIPLHGEGTGEGTGRGQGKDWRVGEGSGG